MAAFSASPWQINGVFGWNFNMNKTNEGKQEEIQKMDAYRITVHLQHKRIENENCFKLERL